MPPTPNWKLETNGSFRSRNTLAGSSLVAWQGILAVHDCKLSMTLHPFQFRHGCCIRAEGFLQAFGSTAFFMRKILWTGRMNAVTARELCG